MGQVLGEAGLPASHGAPGMQSGAEGRREGPALCLVKLFLLSLSFPSVCTYDISHPDLLSLFRTLTLNGGLCQTLLMERLLCL